MLACKEYIAQNFALIKVKHRQFGFILCISLLHSHLSTDLFLSDFFKTLRDMMPQTASSNNTGATFWEFH